MVGKKKFAQSEYVVFYRSLKEAQKHRNKLKRSFGSDAFIRKVKNIWQVRIRR